MGSVGVEDKSVTLRGNIWSLIASLIDCHTNLRPETQSRNLFRNRIRARKTQTQTLPHLSREITFETFLFVLLQVKIPGMILDLETCIKLILLCFRCQNLH